MRRRAPKDEDEEVAATVLMKDLRHHLGEDALTPRPSSRRDEPGQLVAPPSTSSAPTQRWVAPTLPEATFHGPPPAKIPAPSREEVSTAALWWLAGASTTLAITIVGWALM